MSIAVLGPVSFEVNADKVLTWREARRSAAARWATHDVYQGKPLSEFLGPGLTKISMSVRLDITRGVVPRDELRRMRDLMDTGAVSQFTVGSELVGDFILKDLEEEWTHMSSTGTLMVAQMSISLEEYA